MSLYPTKGPSVTLLGALTEAQAAGTTTVIATEEGGHCCSGKAAAEVDAVKRGKPLKEAAEGKRELTAETAIGSEKKKKTGKKGSCVT